MLEKLQRPMLFIGVFLTGYLLLLQWDADYGENAQQSTEESRETYLQEVESPSVQESTQDFIEPGTGAANEGFSGSDIDDTESSSAKPVATISIENDKLKLIVNLHGGDIIQAALKDYKEERAISDPLLLLRQDRERLSIAQSGFIGRDGFDGQPSGRPLYVAEENNYKMAPGQQELRVPLSFSKDGVEVIKTFVLRRGRHDIDIDMRINNRGEDNWRANLFAQFKRDSKRPTYEKSAFGTRSFTGVAFSSESDNYNKLNFDDIEARAYQGDTKGGWVAMVQHYFVAAFIPEKVGSQYAYSARRTPSGDYIFGFVGPTFQVGAGRSYQDSINLYVGPKIKESLETLAPHLALTIDYGWLWYISQPLFSFLKFLHGFLANWGLAIMVMTFLIKLVFYPLTNASYKSMAKMRKLQPQMEQIRKNYGDNRQAMQKEVMEMYKREKVNPMGGCLPILIQMPIFIAFYWALIESVELRHAPLIWWIQDLSAKDPFYILPLLMGASMFVQQLFSPMPADPIQARVMRLLPVIFTVFFLWFPSGLVLYWLVNNILSITQQYIINRRLGTAVTPKITLFGRTFGGSMVTPNGGNLKSSENPKEPAKKEMSAVKDGTESSTRNSADNALDSGNQGSTSLDNPVHQRQIKPFKRKKRRR